MLACAALLVAASVASPAGAFLRQSASHPDYLMAKLEYHRVVIVGESHWIAHEVALVRDLVPNSAERSILLGMEMVAASEQADLDAVCAWWLALSPPMPRSISGQAARSHASERGGSIPGSEVV